MDRILKDTERRNLTILNLINLFVWEARIAY